MSNPQVIGGGRMSRMERGGDGRKGGGPKVSRVKTMRRLWRYMGVYRGLLVLSLILAVAGNALGLVGPKLSGTAIDAIGIGAGEADFPVIIRMAILMALAYLGSAVIGYILSRVMLRLRRKVVTQMRRDVFNRMVSLPVGFFDRHQTGDLISVITYDIDTVNESLSSDVIQLLRSLVTVVVSLVMMLTIAPQLVLVFLVTVPASALYTRWATGRARPMFRARSAKLGALNGMMEQMMDGQRTTKAYAREEEVISRFGEANDDAVAAYSKAEYAGTLVFSSVNLINNISLALVSVFGGLLYLAGGVGLGDISAFVQYSRKFSGPINETASIVGELQSAFAAAERVFRLLDTAPEPADAKDAMELKDVRGDVRLENVTFSYLPQVPVIKNLSLTARPGDVVAIVGPTGAGKTTIINLLMRFYDIDSGCITVDGKDIYTLTRDSLRGAFTMVLQDNWLFYGTVYENIAYGRPGASLKEVEEAAKAAMIHNFIMRLPQGYDTMIGDSGHAISKGQAQLLTIARAMLGDARMLILDEATSNVDTRTEQRIQKAMLELMRGRTSFVIAHRLSTIRNADHILVVKDGSVIEQGSHENLMKNQGFYARLYQAQFETA
ncbi:MAG: ABC transporter ATP-binding protein [Eubacteriales bacterium]|nr:ABC transporter ATP-binding protein [Eubacteriales bacterium]